jgi:hypothetical protein
MIEWLENNELEITWEWLLPKWHVILDFAWRDPEKSQKKNSVRIASVLAKIQTERLLNSSLERYHYINLLNHFTAN